MKRNLTLIVIVFSLLALAGCDIFEPEHTHEYGEWTVIKEASCTEEGTRVRGCSCGERDREIIPAKGHTEEILAGYPATCTESGLTEGKKCTVCGETTVAQEEILVLKHDYKYTEVIDENNNFVTLVVCQRENCGHTSTSTAGLYDKDDNLLASWEDLVNIYMLSIENGTMSNLLEFYSNCKKSEIILKVTKLILDDAITSVDFVNFMQFKNLTQIVIPSGVSSIIHTSWENCANLINIIVDENNDYYKSIDGNLYSKDGTTFIQYAGGKRDSEFIIPSHVTNIGQCAFYYSNYLKSIVIPSSVTKIEAAAFYYCDLLKDIYFEGTEEQWKALNYTRQYMPDSIFIHYDGKIEFITRYFLHYSGMSRTYRLQIVLENGKIYICEHLYMGDTSAILYNQIGYIKNLKFGNSENVLLLLKNQGDEERLSQIQTLLSTDKWYILERTLDNEQIERIAICQIDNVYYFVSSHLTKSNEEFDINTIHTLTIK